MQDETSFLKKFSTAKRRNATKKGENIKSRKKENQQPN